MQRVKLNDNVSFSRIIQGFWRLGRWEGGADELASFINEAIDMGVTSFDTAEIYGESEALFGNALASDASIRGRIEIITKTGISRSTAAGKPFGYYDTRAQHIIDACKASLSRLHTDHVDCYLIHREDPCINHEETAEALTRLKAEGLVLSVGVSNFDPYKLRALNSFMNNTLVTDQIELNPICFEHFDSGLMDYLQEIKMPPMAWSPLDGGRIFTHNDPAHCAFRENTRALCEKYSVTLDTLVYAYLLYHPARIMPISGSSSTARLKAAVDALAVRLEHEDWYRIYTASGKQILR